MRTKKDLLLFREVIDGAYHSLNLWKDIAMEDGHVKLTLHQVEAIEEFIQMYDTLNTKMYYTHQNLKQLEDSWLDNISFTDED